MAGSTTTSVVQVNCIDADGYSSTFNLDNPKENLTLNQVKNAFATAISDGWWFGNRGSAIVEVRKATYSLSQKIEISGATVSVTPASWNFNSSPSASFTVENAVPTALRIVDSNVTNTSGNSATWQWYNLNINGQNVSVSGTSLNAPSGTTHFEGTATLQIWFNAEKVDVPLTVSMDITNM